MLPQGQEGRSTQSNPQNGNQNQHSNGDYSNGDHLEDANDDSMGNPSNTMQSPRLRRTHPSPVRPQSAGGFSQSNIPQNTSASTTDMPHAHPEPLSSPRTPRARPFDPWNNSLPSPDFESGPLTAFGTGHTQNNGFISLSSSNPQNNYGPWTAPGAGHTQTSGATSAFSSIPQELAGIGSHLIGGQTNRYQAHPNDRTRRTGSCCCRSVWVIIDGPPIITFICHCSSCKKIFGSDRVALARYRIDNVNISNTRSIRSYQVDNVTHYFCATCGTVFELRPSTNRAESVVPVALFDDQNGTLAPQMEVYCSRQAPWFPVLVPRRLRYDQTPLPFYSHLHWRVPHDLL
ncbi:Mss4-like protein [Rostrohypoxylon terebratum]|nr:Mss4-like protein [Rostrohypoxylon terebratum]